MTRTRDCPNFETCEGEIEFFEDQWEQGPYADGSYLTGWQAVAETDTCSAGCTLTQDQLKRLETDATDAMLNDDPWGVD